MKRGEVTLTDTERAALDALLGDRQTGVRRDDLVAGIAESIRIRQENTHNGAALINALHRDSGSWRTCEYLTRVKRGALQRWGKKVVDANGDTDTDDAG
jgi:hypothetical protein